MRSAFRAGLLVDLDDTLFDHRRSVIAGLRAVRARYAPLRSIPFATAVDRYQTLLEELHPTIVRGEISAYAARRRRLATLLAEAGIALHGSDLTDAVRVYRAGYSAAERTVPGALGLLRSLRPAWRIVVVTNNRRAEQLRKLNGLGLSRYLDGLATSEEAGAGKPHPAVFRRGLELLGVPRGQVVVLGDSWRSDVEGARAMGLPVVWLNRTHAPAPFEGVPEIPGLTPLDVPRRALDRELAHLRRRRFIPPRG